MESPILCTAWLSGGTPKKRIEEIMTNQIMDKLHLAQKCLFIVASFVAVGGPIVLGLATGPTNIAQAQTPTGNQQQEAIKPQQQVIKPNQQVIAPKQQVIKSLRLRPFVRCPGGTYFQ